MVAHVDATKIIVGAATLVVGGADLGYTKGGVTVRYEPEFIEVIADQAVGVVKKARSLERMYVTTTMLQVSLDQMRKSFMQPSSQLSGSILTIGYNDSCWVDEIAIVIVGKGPNCGVRTFSFGKCITFGTREYTMQREEEVAFEIEFEVLKTAAGVFGTITDSAT
jgi:hypothetical protein